MRNKVFLSYRRADSQQAAGRLHALLTQALGEGAVLIDVQHFPLGESFIRAQKRALTSDCAACLVMIGKDWLKQVDERGNRRLNEPSDPVRLEIATALQEGLPIIPVLVDEAQMPQPRDLPPDLAALSSMNGVSVRHESFELDAARLVTHLRGLIRRSQLSPEYEPVPEVRYSAEYARTLHRLRILYRTHQAGLLQAAADIEDVLFRAFKDSAIAASVKVTVAELDYFRLKFKMAYDQLIDSDGVDPSLIHRLLSHPFVEVGDLIRIELGNVRAHDDERARSLVEQHLGAVIESPPAQASCILGLAKRSRPILGRGEERIEIGRLRLAVGADAGSPRNGWWRTISLREGYQLMARYRDDAKWAGALDECSVDESSFFTFACCAFSGTCIESSAGAPSRMYERATDYEDSELYAIELWLKHAIHAARVGQLNRVRDLREAAERGWPGVVALRRGTKRERTLFWPGHVTGDLIKALIFGSPTFRNAHPILTETRAAADEWWAGR